MRIYLKEDVQQNVIFSLRKLHDVANNNAYTQHFIIFYENHLLHNKYLCCKDEEKPFTTNE